MGEVISIGDWLRDRGLEAYAVRRSTETPVIVLEPRTWTA